MTRVGIDRTVHRLPRVARRAKIRPDEPGRERLHLAALELFGERGYEAVSIAAIGERAGITKSVLYHHFGSKAELYRAVCTEQTEALLARVAAVAADDSAGPGLQAGIDAYLEFLAARPAAWRLLLRDRPADPELARFHRELEEERATALGELLAPGKGARKPAQLALVTTGIRAFASWWYEHQEIPREQVTDAIVAFARAGAENLARPARKSRG